MLGPEHRSVAESLNNLAGLYRDQGKYAEAQLLYNRSLAIDYKVLGPEHPWVATDLNNLAELYCLQESTPKPGRLQALTGDLGEGPGARASAGRDEPQQPGRALPDPGQVHRAEPLYMRSLTIRGEVSGTSTPRRGQKLHQLGRALPSPEASMPKPSPTSRIRWRTWRRP